MAPRQKDGGHADVHKDAKVHNPGGGDSVAAPQSATKVRKGGRINLDASVRFLQHIRVSQLDGLFFAVRDKMDSLDVKPSSKAHPSRKKDAEKTSVATVPAGNIRGILRFVEGAQKDDAEALQTLDAVITSRFNAAGYEPKNPDEGEGSPLT